MEKFNLTKKITDLSKVQLGTNVCYFTNNRISGEKVFREGGKIHYKKGLPEYIILTNGIMQWDISTNEIIEIFEILS